MFQGSYEQDRVTSSPLVDSSSVSPRSPFGGPLQVARAMTNIHDSTQTDVEAVKARLINTEAFNNWTNQIWHQITSLYEQKVKFFVLKDLYVII